MIGARSGATGALTSGWLVVKRARRSASIGVLTGNATVLLLTVATGVVSARLLGPEGRGQQAAMIMWPQLLAGLFAAGLPSALLFNLRQRGAEAPALLNVALCAAFAVGLGAAAIGVFAVAHTLADYPVAMRSVALLALLTTPIEVMAMVLQAASQATGRYDVYNRVRVSVPIVMLGALLALPYVTTPTPIATSLAMLLSGMPVVALHFLQVRRQFGRRSGCLADARTALYRYARKAASVDLLNTVVQQVDRVVLVTFLPPADVGLYLVAVSAVMPLSAVSTALVAIVFPRAAALPAAERTSLCIVAALANVSLMIVGAGLLWLLAPFLLSVLYGGWFVQAVPVLHVLILNAVLATTCQVLSQLFMAQGRPEIAARAQMAWVVTLLPLMIWLVSRMGLDGAALAVLGATGVRTVYVLCCVRSAARGVSLRPAVLRRDIKQLLA